MATDVLGIIDKLRRLGVEPEDVEVKKAAGGLPRSTVETISAFANCRGGVLILGVDEANGFEISGVDDPGALRDALSEVCRSKLTPALQPSVEVVEVEGRSVIVAEVEELPVGQKPSFITTKGRYGGSYARCGDGDFRLTQYEVDRLVENAEQPKWDREPVADASPADLDPDAVSTLLRRVAERTPRAFKGVAEEEALLRLGMLSSWEERNVPSLAGLLLLGTYPQQYMPQLMITVTVFPGLRRDDLGPGGERFMDSEVAEGGLADMVETAVHAVRRNLRTTSRIEGVGRMDSPEIATEVIREVLVNAVMHRDYSPGSRGTQIQVELFPDRMEVRSPGGLFGNVRPEALGEAGTSSSRNALLAARLMEVGDPVTGRPIAENRGSGLTMIIAEVRRATQTVPVFQSTLDDFRVTIPRAAPVTLETVEWAQRVGITWALTPAQVGALAAAKAGYAIDAAFLRRMGIDVTQSHHQLAQLAKLGLLTPLRVRQGGQFRLADELPERESLRERVQRELSGGAAMRREDLEKNLEVNRGRLTTVLNQLLSDGLIEATAPPKSPKRRYRKKSRSDAD